MIPSARKKILLFVSQWGIISGMPLSLFFLEKAILAPFGTRHGSGLHGGDNDVSGVRNRLRQKARCQENAEGNLEGLWAPKAPSSCVR